MATLTLETLNVETLTEQELTDLAERLEQDEYTNVFDGLADWHLLRAIAFQCPDRVAPYMHLLDLQSFDES